MGNKRNYSKELDKITLENEQMGRTPTLLLQACCAPCSSACLERLRENFLVTVYYYNPNITEAPEYEKRKAEEKRLIAELNRQVEEQDFMFRRSRADDSAEAGRDAEIDGTHTHAEAGRDAKIDGTHTDAEAGRDAEIDGIHTDAEAGRDAETDGTHTDAEAGRPAEAKGMHSTAKAHRIEILEAPYDPERFLAMAKGLEDIPEGGERCFRCYALRLGQTAKAAKEGGYDYFSTTLTISPLKNADKLNEIGERIAAAMRSDAKEAKRSAQNSQPTEAVIAADEESETGKVPAFLPSDFKKKNGYLRSIELSREFGLYRQNYCGCKFSRQQAEKQRNKREEKE